MPYEMIPELAAYCQKQGIDFMSTPFSAADFAAIDPFTAVHKIASYEISHVHLLRLAAQSGKPLVLSTGAARKRILPGRLRPSTRRVAVICACCNALRNIRLPCRR